MSDSHDESDHVPTGLPEPEEVSEEEKEEIEEERQARLDPDQRPDSAQVDNTDRDFDPAAGMFTDNPEHAETDRPYSAEDEA